MWRVVLGDGWEQGFWVWIGCGQANALVGLKPGDGREGKCVVAGGVWNAIERLCVWIGVLW
jgi:hypothetical protein